MTRKNMLVIELMDTYMYNERGANISQYKVDQFNVNLRHFLERRTLDELEGSRRDWLNDTVNEMWQEFCDNEEENEMNNYTYSDYTLFATGDNFGSYLVLEEDGSYNHLVFNWDLSDTEVSAIANKFYTVGLTEDDFCAWDWEESNFREMYNSFYKVEGPSLKVYVNDPGDIVILLHMGKDNNMWAYMNDEEAVSFLASYAEGNGKWENMEDFQHFLDRMYYTDEEVEEAFEGLELVGENYILFDKVNEDWPVYSVLKRGGFHYATERIATIHGRVPTQEDLDNIAGYMNDEYREDLHMEIAPCTPEYFLSEYIWKYSDTDPDFYDILRDEFGFKWATLK